MEFWIAGDPLPFERSLETITGYAERHAKTLDQYDFATRGDANSLAAEDIWTTRIIASRVTHSQKEAIERASVGWEDLWLNVPAEAHIRDADPHIDGGLYDDMLALFGRLDDVSGISWAKASKILHFKRPHLYPIIDSHLRVVYAEAAVEAARQYPGRGYRKMYWAAIRNDVKTNTTVLKVLREVLAGREEPIQARMAALSDIRILDILAWAN